LQTDKCMNIIHINLLPKIQVFWDVPLFRRSCLRFEGYDGVFIVKLKQSTRLDVAEGELSPTPLKTPNLANILFMSFSLTWIRDERPENRGSIPVEGKHYSFYATSRLGGSLNFYPMCVVGFLSGVKLGGVKLTTSI